MEAQYNTMQFDRFDSKSSFVEVCESFSIDKIRLGFRKFNQANEKGNRIMASVDIYLSIRDAKHLAFLIMTNSLNYNDNSLYKSKIGGFEKDGEVGYRLFSIMKGTKADYAIGCNSGIGKKDDKGLI